MREKLFQLGHAMKDSVAARRVSDIGNALVVLAEYGTNEEVEFVCLQMKDFVEGK